MEARKKLAEIAEFHFPCKVMRGSTMLGRAHDGSPCPCANCNIQREAPLIARAFAQWALGEAIYIVSNQPSHVAVRVLRGLAVQIGGDSGK